MKTKVNVRIITLNENERILEWEDSLKDEKIVLSPIVWVNEKESGIVTTTSSSSSMSVDTK